MYRKENQLSVLSIDRVGLYIRQNTSLDLTGLTADLHCPLLWSSDRTFNCFSI